MKDGPDERKSSLLDVNGHALGSEFIADRPAEPAGEPAAKETADREATRYLSAATQVNIEYAEIVVKRVVSEQLRALAPTFGVNVPVVVRWALKALRTRSLRDYMLTVILVLQALSVVILILWWLWAWILFLLLLAAAWLVVSWEYDERIHKTVIRRMLRDRFRPEEAPAAVRQTDIDRLRVIAERREGNLVVFSGHQAFIGSGDPLYTNRLLLHVGAKKDKDGKSQGEPHDFNSQDILTALVAAFDRDRGLGRSLGNIRVGERMFVNGLHVHNDERLLPSRLRPPLTSVDPLLLREAALNPSPEARTYVCVEMPGWQGQLVVTLFIRAVYAGTSLFVEWTFRVLPPIRSQFRQIDRLYYFPRHVQVRTALRQGLREVVPALLRSPVSALRLRRIPWAADRAQRRQENEIENGFIFDYGAQRSIREDASGSQREHYFLARDETMYVLLAQQTLIQTVEKFLEDHGVDLSAFKDQVKVIFDNSIKYNIGDIKDSSGVAIGPNSSARVNEPPKGSNEQR